MNLVLGLCAAGVLSREIPGRSRIIGAPMSPLAHVLACYGQDQSEDLRGARLFQHSCTLVER